MWTSKVGGAPTYSPRIQIEPPPGPSETHPSSPTFASPPPGFGPRPLIGQVRAANLRSAPPAALAAVSGMERKGTGAPLLHRDVETSTARGDDPIEPERFARIRERFAARGRTIDVSDDAQRFLAMREAEAVTFNADLIMMKPEPSKSALFEELIHATQHREGRVDRWTEAHGPAAAVLLAEYRAASRLVENHEAYGISPAEHARNLVRVETFGKELDEAGIPRPPPFSASTR